MKIKKIAIERTKKGYPAHWEQGGGYTNTGVATIIAGKNGQPKKPIYVRARGHLANGKHALIPLEIGDYIIRVHHKGDFFIEILKIIDFEVEKYTTYGNAMPGELALSEEEFKKMYGVSFDEIDAPVLKNPLGYPLKYIEVMDRYVSKTGWGSHTIYEKIEEEETYAVVELVADYSQEKWEPELPAHLETAVQGAMEKATCYHCRSPHYIAE